MTIQCVYVAGAMTADFDGYLKNIKKGIDACAILRKWGLSPLPFWTDFIEILCNPGDITTTVLPETNIPWLDKSDIVYVLSGWEHSKGTRKEIDRATRLGIPIVYTLNDLLEAAGKI